MITRLIATSACISLLAAGCVTGPLDGDSIADRHTDTFDFYGFTTVPGESVTIQAVNDSGTWTTIGSAVSSNTAIPWQGTQLYPWSDYKVAVPVHGHYWQPISNRNFHHRCEVRVLDSSGEALLTFDQNYDPSLKPLDLWDQAGNGESLTVFSVN